MDKYYEVLGLDPNKKDEYTSKDLKRAYKKRMCRFSPDRAEKKIIEEIIEAYEMLIGPVEKNEQRLTNEKAIVIKK